MPEMKRPSIGLLKWIVFWTLTASVLFGGRWFLRLIYPAHYSQTVNHFAARAQLDPFLVHALIRVESRYNPRARSAKGALGLMQLLPDTARWIADKNGLPLADENLLYDPEINIQLGTEYLRDLLGEFDGRLPVALAAYNAGRGNVRKWLDTGAWSGDPKDIAGVPFPETRNYLTRIYAAWNWYRRLYD